MLPLDQPKQVDDSYRALGLVREAEADVAEALERRGIIPVTRAEWESRYEAAKALMQQRSLIKRALIEVAAQHPLVSGELPNEEFTCRLQQGAALSSELRQEGFEVEIYVPGSRHSSAGVADKISLSEAGIRFLREAGLPEDSLHGNDLNQRYKGEAGVYCSADECFTAASYFKEGGFGRLLCVVSPVQVYRKMLHYVWNGVLPLVHTAPTAGTYHSWIREAFEALPYVLHVDPSLQDPESVWGNDLRAQRRPQS